MIVKNVPMTSVETGETFIFRQLAADTGGRLLEMDMITAPGGGAKAAPMHIHPVQEERFYITSGVMQATIDGETHVYRAGDTLIIPAGTPHTWFNPSDTENLEFRLEFEPALRWEEMFETLAATSRAGKLDKNGKPSPFLMAVVLHHYTDHMLVAGIPAAVQKRLFAVLALVGRLMGHKSYSPYFTQAEAKEEADTSEISVMA